MKSQARFIFLLLFAFAASAAFAVPATPFPVVHHQPDGSAITVRLYGDRFFSYRTTEDGYVIFQNEDGYYVYAERDDNGELVPSSVIARDAEKRTAQDRSFLSKYTPHEPFSESTMQKVPKHRGCELVDEHEDEELQKVFPSTGNVRGLVILVNFKDLKYVVPNPQQTYSNMLNQEGYRENGGFGSARDYFKQSSMGKFAPVFDVFGPYDLPEDVEYYGGGIGPSGDRNAVQMIKDACKLASLAGVDFANYDIDNDGYVDNVFVYYAGNNEAEQGPIKTVWPHRYELPGDSVVYNGKVVKVYACTSELRGDQPTADYMCGIGTFCHEFSHVLGLKDLYCTGSDCSIGAEINYFHDIMDKGNYVQNGKCPPSYSGHERFYVGWGTPTVIDQPADLTLEPLSSSNNFYLISKDAFNMGGKDPNPGNFYLVENRQKVGFDTCMPGHGLLIWKVQFNTINWMQNRVNSKQPLGVAIVPADGNRGIEPSSLAADYFPGTANVDSFQTSMNNVKWNMDLTNITENADKTVSFKFMGGNGSGQKYVNLSSPDLLLDSRDGAQSTFVISSNASWTIAKNDPSSPFQITPLAGSGNQTITVTVSGEGKREGPVDTLIITAGSLERKLPIQQAFKPLVNRCDWTTNYDTLLNDKYYYSLVSDYDTSATAWGYTMGQNSVGFNIFVDRFNMEGEAVLDTFRFLAAKVFASDPATSKITFCVYDDNHGVPGNTLATKDVLLKDVLFTENDTMNAMTFDPPVIVNGPFYLGYKVYYNKIPLDTFSCSFASDTVHRRVGYNATTYMSYRDTWMPYHFIYGQGSEASMIIDVHLDCSNGKNILPVISLEQPSDAQPTSIRLHANIERSGSYAISSKGFVCSETKGFDPKTVTPLYADGTAVGKYEVLASGLTNGNKLYYRAFVRTTDTVVYTNEDSLTVGSLPPFLNLNPNNILVSTRVDNIAIFSVFTNLNWTLSYTGTWFTVDANSGTGNKNITLTVVTENLDTLHGRTDTITVVAGNFVKKIIVNQDVKIPVTIPTVTTATRAELVTRRSARLSGTVNSAGAGVLTERGFELSLSVNFATILKKIVDSSLIQDNYSLVAMDLEPKTFYYYRAYAINEAGTGYGTGRSFSTSSTSPYLTLNSSSFMPQAYNSMSSKSINVTSNVVWTVEVDAAVNWLKVTPTTGFTNGSFSIAITDSNTNTDARYTSIYVRGEGVEREVTVYQLGKSGNVTYVVTPSVLNFSSGSLDTFSFINVYSSGDWTVSTDADWVILGRTTGSNSNSIKVTARGYASSDRTATVKVKETSSQIEKTVTVNQLKSTAINPERTKAYELKIVPNPATEHVNVTAPVKISKVEVLDMLGKTLPVSASLKGNTAEFGVAHLQTGYYYVRVYTAQGVLVEKMIKQ